MRTQLNKKNYTKAERIFGRILRENRIAFKTKVKIKGQEVDFVIGRYAVEINGHEQDIKKNKMLVSSGYAPLHLHNSEVKRETVIKLLNTIHYELHELP